MRIVILLFLALASAAGGASAAWMMRGTGVANASSEDAEEYEGHYAYVELQNQFVVPLTEGNAIAGLVAVSLALEGHAGEEAAIANAEPRLRDAFLRVLFDHARADGFTGDFTNGTSMSELRTRLDQAAVEVLGTVVNGVLITSIARQDF